MNTFSLPYFLFVDSSDTGDAAHRGRKAIVPMENSDIERGIIRVAGNRNDPRIIGGLSENLCIVFSDVAAFHEPLP